MKPVLDYKPLEKKYGIKLNYPNKARMTYRDKIMSNMCILYRNIREKTMYRIPLTKREERYWLFKENYRLREEDNSAKIANGEPFINVDFIHMFDCLPKENIPQFLKQLAEFRKKHVSFDMGVGDEDKRVLEISGFGTNGLRMPVYSFGIKDTSPLAEYIKAIYIGFQDLTTSLNVVLYTIVLKQDLVDKLSNIYVDKIEGFSYLNGQNLKWYEFYKMGWNDYSGYVYKKEFVNDCINNIKWNILRIMRNTMTIYLTNDNELLPSINVYRTNIDGNANSHFWSSINVRAPQICDFFKDNSACISWSNENGDIDCIYNGMGSKREGSFREYSFPMDIRYYYSRYLVANTFISQTYVRVGKYMECINRFNIQNYGLRIWLNFKKVIEKEILYYKRFFNEFNEHINANNEIVNFLYSGKIGIEHSITERLFGTQYVKVKEAAEVLNQINNYLDTNIDYRNSNENFRIQKSVLMLTAVSSIIAILALAVSCITNQDIVNYILKNKLYIAYALLGCIFLLCIGKLVKILKFLFKH